MTKVKLTATHDETRPDRDRPRTDRHVRECTEPQPNHIIVLRHNNIEFIQRGRCE
jgi:hypothetical protein